MSTDLINFLDGLVGRMSHGPMHKFTYSRAMDYAGYEVESILRRYGIRIWGRGFTDSDEIEILVKRSQARWAEYLLCRAGIPLTSPLLDPSNASLQNHHPEGAMPTPWDERGVGPHSFIDHVVDWLDRLLG